MNRDIAVSLLRRYRKTGIVYNLQLFSFGKPSIELRSQVYESYLIGELIRRINDSEDDPIAIVYDRYGEMDYILGESREEAMQSHEFAAMCVQILGDILKYLKRMERNYGDVKWTM